MHKFALLLFAIVCTLALHAETVIKTVEVEGKEYPVPDGWNKTALGLPARRTLIVNGNEIDVSEKSVAFGTGLLSHRPSYIAFEQFDTPDGPASAEVIKRWMEVSHKIAPSDWVKTGDNSWKAMVNRHEPGFENGKWVKHLNNRVIYVRSDGKRVSSLLGLFLNKDSAYVADLMSEVAKHWHP